MDTLFMNISDTDATRMINNDKSIDFNCEMIKDEDNRTNPDKFFINSLLQDTRVRAIQNKQIGRKYLLQALYKEKDQNKRAELRISINKSICEEINLLSYIIHDVNEKDSKYSLS